MMQKARFFFAKEQAFLVIIGGFNPPDVLHPGCVQLLHFNEHFNDVVEKQNRQFTFRGSLQRGNTEGILMEHPLIWRKEQTVFSVRRLSFPF